MSDEARHAPPGLKLQSTTSVVHPDSNRLQHAISMMLKHYRVEVFEIEAFEQPGPLDVRERSYQLEIFDREKPRLICYCVYDGGTSITSWSTATDTRVRSCDSKTRTSVIESLVIALERAQSALAMFAAEH